jgi:16S rRNA (uracil1498-N3)-methyltransferase
VEADTATLAGPEAHHALHVVRVQHEDPVILFDGMGRELKGRIADRTRHEVTVEVDEARNVQPELRALTLLQASLLRDKSIEELIRRCTEIGVGHFVFYPSERSERPPKLSDKWRRWAIESCKQCGCLWLPEFAIAPDLGTALEGSWSALLVATGDREPVPLREAVEGDTVGLAIGPEGDFTSEELDVAKAHNARPISLGPATFRSEVAATVACALVRYELGCLGP